jgi:iron(III) transport system substrate-binding protein
MRRLIAIVVAFASCKPLPPPLAEVRLETNLDAAAVDTALQLVARSGGPRAERTNGDADVRLDDEPYAAIAAAARGELDLAPESARDVPPLWRDPAGTWVAVGGRADVLLVNQDLTKDHAAPQRLSALTEPWLKGKVALATPGAGMALAHFAALYQAWGRERMEDWLSKLAANDPQVLASDAEVRLAVVQGKAAVGLLASDEAAKAVASAARVTVIYPDQRGVGTFVWPTALSLRKGAPEPARKLAERLADRSIEALLVARVPGYLPLRADIPVPPGVRSATSLVVVSVDPARIVAAISERKDALADWAKRASRR